MKRTAALILTVAATAVLTQASPDVSTYDYDTSEDWLKVAAGTFAGIATAYVAD